MLVHFAFIKITYTLLILVKGEETYVKGWSGADTTVALVLH